MKAKVKLLTSGRAFTPPNAGYNLHCEISKRMGNPKKGAEKRFSEATGIAYETIRQWVYKPIIPFLLAEFVAVWLNTDVKGLMEMGVRITSRTRKRHPYMKSSGVQEKVLRKKTFLKAPSLKDMCNPHFRCVAWMLGLKDFPIEYVSKDGDTQIFMPKNLNDTDMGQYLLYREKMKETVSELIKKYALKDMEMFSPE